MANCKNRNKSFNGAFGHFRRPFSKITVRKGLRSLPFLRGSRACFTKQPTDS